MNKLIITIVILAATGLIWSAASFFNLSKSTNKASGSAEDFARAVEAEAVDKCQTPPGYTEEEWLAHLSHHPDRYQECLTTNQNEPNLSYQNINALELALMLEAKNFTLIDVHVPEQSHVPGTDKLIPYNEITTRLNELPQDKNAAIVLYCRSGSMSQQAAKALAGEGFTNVYNLEGGLNAWLEKGYEVENSFFIN